MRKAVDREEDQCDDASIRQAIFGLVLACTGKNCDWLWVSSVVAQGPGEIHYSMQLAPI